MKYVIFVLYNTVLSVQVLVLGVCDLEPDDVRRRHEVYKSKSSHHYHALWINFSEARIVASAEPLHTQQFKPSLRGVWVVRF